MDQLPNPDATPAAPPVKLAIDCAVEFSQRVYGGQTSYVVQHTELGKFYRFGVEEYHVASLLDGSRSAKQVYDQVVADGLGWSPEDVARFLGQLVNYRLAVPVGDHSNPAARAPGSATSRTANGEPEKGKPERGKPERGKPEHWAEGLERRLPAALSMLVSQRFPLTDGDRAAQKAQAFLGPLFTRVGVAAWILLVLSGLAIVYGNFLDYTNELRRLFDTGLWPLLIVVWCVLKVLHELGHAVCARNHGVRVGRLGIMFFLLAPLAYVDVTDAWKLKRRFRRVQIAMAGVYVELAIAAIAAWAWWLLPVGLLKHMAAQVFVVAGPATLLVNANPLLRLDGYYVLSDLLEIPNLRMHGRRQLVGIIEQLAFSIPRPQSLLAGWRSPAATIHAVCSVTFQFFWMSGLIIAVSMWMQGLGIVLAIAAFLLWGLLPLSRWTRKIWMHDPPTFWRLNQKRVSLIGYAVLFVLTIHHLSVSSSPLARRVPVVVRYQDEQIARASTDAFVESVYVTRGQRVSKGMLLIELRQPELHVQRGVLADDLSLSEQRAIQFRRQGKIGLANAESEKAASLRRQLAEVDQQVQGLRVFAQRDGLVTTALMDRLVGTYVQKGAELIRVSDPNEKELLVTVSQRDTEAYHRAVGSVAQIRLRGGTQLNAQAEPLRPRARQSLPHPALAATSGGPLAVEPSADENGTVRLVEPQLESVAPLDPIASAAVRAGQVGTMTIADNRSLVARLVDSLRASNSSQ